MAAKTKKFYSEDGTTIRVTLPDGGVALIGEEPREIPKKFWKAAVKEGALTSDQNITRADLSDVSEGDEAEARERAIYDLILAAWEASEDETNTDEKFEGSFTESGKPNVRWLEKQLGFKVEGDERDHIWDRVQAENGEDEQEAEESDSEQQ